MECAILVNRKIPICNRQRYVKQLSVEGVYYGDIRMEVKYIRYLRCPCFPGCIKPGNCRSRRKGVCMV